MNRNRCPRSLAFLLTAFAIVTLGVGCGGGSGADPTATALTIDATIVATAPATAEVAIKTVEVPPPEDCVVAPRTIESLFAVATPAGDGTRTVTSLTVDDLPGGSPADEATVAAVTETLRQWVACTNAGDDLRSYALVTDDFLRRSIAALGFFAPVEIEVMQASPEPLVAEGRLALMSIREVQVLPDGRVGAIVWVDTAANPLPPEAGERFFAFARTGDVWLIDEVVQLSV